MNNAAVCYFYKAWGGAKGRRSFELVLHLRSWTQSPVGSLCRNHYLWRICSLQDTLLSVLGSLIILRLVMLILNYYMCIYILMQNNTFILKAYDIQSVLLFHLICITLLRGTLSRYKAGSLFSKKSSMLRVFFFAQGHLWVTMGVGTRI